MQAKFTQYLDENHKRLKDDLVDVFFNDRFIKIEYGKIEEDGERKYGKKFTSAEEAYKVLFERGLVTDMVFVLPLLGVAEFAAFLEIAPSKFSNMYSRQRKGEIVNPPFQSQFKFYLQLLSGLLSKLPNIKSSMIIIRQFEAAQNQTQLLLNNQWEFF